ncbi:MAG: hypothetical protein ASARMPRED_000792 [Alectoria sarmentosa]|nr:MAG: hypothetical protein ASARMPRED_000792 [Alectoria sarmentosa]
MSNNTYENDIRFIWEAPDAYDNGEVDENPIAIVEQEFGQPMLPDEVTAIHQQLEDYLRPIDAFMQALTEQYHPRLFVSLRNHLTHLEGLTAAYATLKGLLPDDLWSSTLLALQNRSEVLLNLESSEKTSLCLQEGRAI